MGASPFISQKISPSSDRACLNADMLGRNECRRHVLLQIGQIGQVVNDIKYGPFFFFCQRGDSPLSKGCQRVAQWAH
jgi:hypothetical protein